MKHNDIPSLLVAVFLLLVGGALNAADRPNILWIVSEDNGRYLGCYGDANARTPNLDRLAAEGVRYTRCYANAPVCAVARSSWIFGVPAPTTGTLHMRSKYRVPRDRFKTYPELLKAAGYYVSNNAKTDYNTRSIDKDAVWNESNNQAHYKNRAEGQPFFAVFDIGQSHESGIFPKNKGREPRVAAADIEVPPYQFPTPEVVDDWRHYYDRLELMDEQVGALLDELEASGEADDTIVAYCSDHAGVTLRTKRFLHDSGTRVPLIVRFPEKWRQLAPQPPGSVSGRLVQFIDMPKTWLSLAGVAPPELMPGRIFLGDRIEPAPESVFLFSARFDECPDNSRAVTDGRWKYIRNFEPDRPRFQMLTYPLRQDGQWTHFEAYKAGRTDPLQSAQYLPQPPEELYDTETDPHEVENLAAANPEMRALMRERLQRHILETRDLGFIPEPMMEAVDDAGVQTVYAFGQSDANYPLAEVLPLAFLASDKDPANLAAFTAALGDDNPVVRYWGAVGMRALGAEAAPAKAAIERATKDSSLSVRVAAAVSLGYIGERERAVGLLLDEAKRAESDIPALWALDGLKLLDAPEAIEGIAADDLKKGNYSGRVVEVLSSGGSTWRIPGERL